jgi:predicted  nucleic acid-binding Zn-ribbon protein
MKETLAQVLVLQDMNRQVQQLQRDVARLSADVDNQGRLVEGLKRRAQELRAQRLEAIKHADAMQLNIQAAEEDVARFNLQLNTARQQREYDAIRHSVLTKQADIQRWEDGELAALQTVDEVAGQEAELAGKLTQAEKEMERIKGQVARDAAETNQRLQKLQREVADLRERISPGVLGAYERLTASRGNSALAEVRARVCQGCFTQITKQTENLLMRDSEIVYCHSCGRILYLAEA